MMDWAEWFNVLAHAGIILWLYRERLPEGSQWLWEIKSSLPVDPAEQEIITGASARLKSLKTGTHA
jgi:hypothetical protein